MDGRLQKQLEEDGGSSTRENWMETSGLWTVFYKSSDTNNRAAHPVARYKLRAIVP